MTIVFKAKRSSKGKQVSLPENSVYVNRARVTPNSSGIFQITVINTKSIDQIFESRKVIGALHPKCNLVENSHPEFCEEEINKDSLTAGKLLSIEQESELKNVLNEFSEMFTTNSMKPKQISVLKHRIITNNALPQFRNPYRIPYAFEKEVAKQNNKMIENDIIRPWNAPGYNQGYKYCHQPLPYVYLYY